MTSEELDHLKEEYLKTKKIKYIGRKPKKDNFKTNDILNVYSTHETQRVL